MMKLKKPVKVKNNNKNNEDKIWYVNIMKGWNCKIKKYHK